MYLDIHGSSTEAIAEAFEDIKYILERGETSGNGTYFGECVSWKLNTFQR